VRKSLQPGAPRGAVVGFAIGAAATAVFEVVHALEVVHESGNLVPFMVGAAVVAAAVALVVARRFWWLTALVAAVAVPVLDAAYQATRLLLCLFTGCDLS
jgi:hypothetical protein